MAEQLLKKNIAAERSSFLNIDVVLFGFHFIYILSFHILDGSNSNRRNVRRVYIDEMDD